MKKILIIHTGGTFGMMPMEPSNTLAPGDIHEQIVTYVPEISQIAKIDITIPYNIDSSNITPFHWKKLVDILIKNQNKYDGFVIIHGTDTMAYTASALSFMLKGFNKPVILTGAQRPLAEIRTDARTNLVNSIEIATQDIQEIAVFFGYYLFRGNRCTKVSVSRYDAFDSPNFPPLAEVGIDIKFNKVDPVPSSSMEIFTDFSNKIQIVHLFPGLDSDYLEYVCSHPESRAILIRAYGAGNVPILDNSIIPAIRKAINAGKIVAVGTQAIHGKVTLDLYDCGEKILEEGAISCYDMTLEASITKMMYLLGKYNDNEVVKQKFTENLVGELSN